MSDSGQANADLDAIARDIRAIARIHGTFTLRSGAVSDTYFDKYRFEADPALLRQIGTALLPLIPSDTSVLAGLEMGGIPLVTINADKANLKLYRIGQRALAPLLNGSRFLQRLARHHDLA